MSLDRSLKTASGGLARHRNVLTRDERVAKLVERGKFDLAAGTPLGLPKVGNRKMAAAKDTKKKDAAADGAATPGTTAAPAAGAKGAAAPAAKAGAAPAAKGAAAKPAAKPAAKGK